MADPPFELPDGLEIGLAGVSPRAVLRRRRRRNNLPPLPDPTPEMAQRVYEIQGILCSTIENIYCRPQFPYLPKEGWKSPKQKVQMWWKAFVRLVTFLDREKIDVREYCLANVLHAYTYSTRTPRITQLSSLPARRIWEEWKKAEEEKWAGSAEAIQGMVRRETASWAEMKDYNLLRAYQEAQTNGVEWAVTLDWGPEIIWLFWSREAHARVAVREALDQEAAENPTGYFLTEYRKVSQDRRRQRRLWAQWDRIIGTSLDSLPSEEVRAKAEAESRRLYTPAELQQRWEAFQREDLERISEGLSVDPKKQTTH